MSVLLAILLLSSAPQDLHLVDYVDVIERNHVVVSHFVNGQRVQLTQWIFWRWNPSLCRYEVIAWRRVFPGSYHWHGKTLRFIDGNHCREIRAVSTRETWTLHDPELADRHVVDLNHRPGLARPK